MDLVVLGSVLVSKDGKRIACDNRITDLSFGYLVELGFITSKTKVVTLVHECQVREIPDDTMKVYDIPVDIIVTPNEVIEVENPPQRLNGISWENISVRQLKNSAILQALKEKKEAAGEVINLKPRSNVEKSKDNRRIRRDKITRTNKRSTNTVDTSEVTEENCDTLHPKESVKSSRIRNGRRLGRKVRLQNVS